MPMSEPGVGWAEGCGQAAWKDAPANQPTRTDGSVQVRLTCCATPVVLVIEIACCAAGDPGTVAPISSDVVDRPSAGVQKYIPTEPWEMVAAAKAWDTTDDRSPEVTGVAQPARPVAE